MMKQGLFPQKTLLEIKSVEEENMTIVELERDLAGNAIMIFQAVNKRGQTFTSKEYRSYKSGRTFADLIFSAWPDMNMHQLYHKIETFKVDSGYHDALFYKLGFLHCYRDKAFGSGNRLPIVSQQIKWEKLAMGKLTQRKQETHENVPFIKVAELVSNEAVFCITDINKGQGSKGPQWYVAIFVDGAVVGDFDATEPVKRTVTFGITGAANDRDRLFEKLVDEKDFPVHNCKIDSIPLKNGNNYSDIVEDETSVCPCGHVPEIQDSLGDLDTHPF
jgi:hypothetical protein